jgi:hypothetical protein
MEGQSSSTPVTAGPEMAAGPTTQQLAEMLLALQHRFEEQALANQQLRESLVAATTSKATERTREAYSQALIPKPPAPPKYKGDRDEDVFERWAFAANEFVFKSERRSPQPFSDDVKIQVVSDYLTADAAHWYEHRTREALTQGTSAFASYEQFFVELRSSFVPQISGLLLFEKFVSFRQTKDMQMNIFVNQFLRYVQRLGNEFSQTSFMYFFLTKVNKERYPRVHEALRSRYNEFKSINDLTNQALLLADQQSPAATTSSASGSSAIMDLDTVQVRKRTNEASSSGFSSKRKTEKRLPTAGSAEYKRIYRDSKCFECNRYGHLAKDCAQCRSKDKGKGPVNDSATT